MPSDTNIDGVINRIQEAFKSKSDNAKKPTVLICGYTGSGKTSLIQGIFGRDTVPDHKIGDSRPLTQNFELYQRPGIAVRLWDSKGLEPGDKDKEFQSRIATHISKMMESEIVDDHVHMVWYTIQGPGARVTDADLQLINWFKELVKNVIVIITKSDITKSQQDKALRDTLTKSANIKPEHILSVAEGKRKSLESLVELSVDLLPEAYRDAFVRSQRVALVKKRERAEIAIHTAAVAAGAAGGANPLPISDAVIITPIQIAMLASLAYVYDAKPDDIRLALGPVVTLITGRLLATSLLKFVPFLGEVITAGVAFTLTEALGFATIDWLEELAEAAFNGDKPPPFEPGRFMNTVSEVVRRQKQ